MADMLLIPAAVPVLLGAPAIPTLELGKPGLAHLITHYLSSEPLASLLKFPREPWHAYNQRMGGTRKSAKRKKATPKK